MGRLQHAGCDPTLSWGSTGCDPTLSWGSTGCDPTLSWEEEKEFICVHAYVMSMSVCVPEVLTKILRHILSALPSTHVLPWQVSISSVCWGHVLLLCWHDVCCGWDSEPLQQDHDAVLHPTSPQFSLFHSTTL